MKRQFVHLSATEETARLVGKRHGEPYVFEIDAKGLLEAGSEFFHTSDDVRLTKEIPTQFLMEGGSSNERTI